MWISVCSVAWCVSSVKKEPILDVQIKYRHILQFVIPSEVEESTHLQPIQRLDPSTRFARSG